MILTPRSSLLALLVLTGWMLPTSVLSQVVTGVTVIRSNRSELLLRVDPVVWLDTVEGGTLLPRFSGAMTANLASPGAPVELELPIPVVLPAPDGSSLEIVSVEYQPTIPARIAPVPHLVRGPDDVPVERFRIDERLYSSTHAPLPVAELRSLGIARDVHAGAIIVRPVQADPASGTIGLLRSVTLRLRYASAPGRAGSRVRMSELTRGAFVNSNVAKDWTLAPVGGSLARPRGVSNARAWIRVDVREDGLQVLTAADFQKGGIDLAGVDASRIAVFGGDGGDLTESVAGVSGEHMHQVPAIVERGGDGRASRVLFYGVGPHRWSYDGFDTLAVHHVSPYVSANSYIVAVDGPTSLDFPARSGPASYDVEPAWGISRLFFEEEKVNAIDVRRVGSGSGRTWFGTEFSVDPRDRPNDLRPFMMSLPGLERTAPIVYRIRVANAGTGHSTFRFWQNDTRLGEVGIGATSEYVRAVAASRVFSLPDASAVPADNRSSLKIEFTSGISASGFLDYYEIHYGRRLVADNGSITFDAPSGAGIARYRVSGFSSDDLVGVDITDPANPVLLERKQSDEFGVFVFHDELPRAREARRYFIVERSATVKPADVLKATFGDLAGRPRNVDVVVVTHEDLKEAAQKYVDFRNAQGRLSAAYVTTSDIYTEYAHGNLDPTAVRNFLGQAFTTWSVKPSYVIFLGDASYDYRNIVTQQKQLVPTYQSDDGDTYNENYSLSYDDYMVRLTNDRLIDVMSGRWPAETAEQANVMVDKLIAYETSRNFGAWRHTVILTADDNLPIGTGEGFVGQSESLARYYMPASQWLDTRKIYLPVYPTERVTTDRKPGAAADLLQYMNRGALVTNWIGHGNPKQWAHELLLERDQFIPRLTNDSALTFVTAATCNFGLFDDPGQVSGAELFLLRSNGGAVAAMSSTRASFIFENERLISTYYDFLFRRDSATLEFPTIGSAFFATKMVGQGRDNDLKYHILGDPAMMLNLPLDIVTIDSLNGVALSDSAAVVAALSVVTVSGTITNPRGVVMEDFDGTAIITLYDADRRVNLMDADVPTTIDFAGGRLFRGPTMVKRGRYTATFRVPKDIAFDTAPARLHVYAYNGHRDAVGANRNVRVFGTDTATVADTLGPTLNVFLDDRSFRSGDLVTSEPLLIVDLFDTSGINSSGSSLGHRIEAWLDNSPNSIDLTEFFLTSGVDYRTGTAERLLLELSPGDHHVRVRAWDIFNNPTEGSALFRITGEGESRLVVSNVVNFPNPMSRATEFTFGHNQSRPLDVEIALYTPAGRRVRTLEARSVSDRFVRIGWDGADSDGTPVGNGVYLYRLRVRVVGDDSAGSFETIEKVAVVR